MSRFAQGNIPDGNVSRQWRFGRRRYGIPADLRDHITPMVDVMLVLLIIFMITAPLLVAGVPVELPNTSAARISQPKKPVIVSLGGDGSLYIRDEQVSQDTLIPRLQALRSTEGDAVVYVRADKKRAYGEVMEILGRVGQSGYARVSLLSQPKSNGGGH